VPQPESQLRKARFKKLESLRAKGIDPYPHRYTRTHTTTEAVSHFESEEERLGQDARTGDVSLAGRIVRLRRMGRATFTDLLDGDGRLQVLFRQNVISDSYEILKDLDIGDWLGVSGPLIRTRTGEITLEAHKLTVLCKSVRPLPEKWHGLADVEIRFRQRYLDLIANEEARRIAVLRSRIISSVRRYMDGRGFMEVETPVLVPVAAGASARPFMSHYNALDRDLYLRIATELYLKRLVVGGLEKVYEIGRVFRNEGVDFYHNPEYTMLESYETLADYNDVMAMVEDMVSTLAREVLGSSSVEYDGHQIDFTPPWPRLSLRSEVKRRTGIDFLEHVDLESLRIEVSALGIDAGQQVSWGGLVDKLLTSAVEPHLLQPTFLVDYPVEMSPLAKKRTDDPRLVERFEGFVGGMELCNAFSELNDPVDQRQRLEEQEALRGQYKDDEMDRLDEDFLVAIEHGMPPTGGLGLGIDRLVMLLSGQSNIREVILFPQLRSR
jgi:lysyl-tRNA synthetase class 2